MKKSLKGVDLTGITFNKLTVLGKGEKAKQGQTRWVCKCVCGKETLVVGRDLVNNHTMSCGCHRREVCINKSTTHGMNKTTEHRIWLNAKDRCLNANNKAYPYYGGRGVKICDRWVNSFACFYLDMGKRPSKDHSIDRFPNKDGDYSPGNCRWATRKEQAENTRRNRWFEYNGIKLTLNEWSKLFKAYPTNVSRMLERKSFEMVYNFYMKTNP